MSVCAGWSLYRAEHGNMRGMTLFCRSWLCTDCAPKRTANLARHAMNGQPSTFLTLTVNPAIGESADSRAQSLSDAFKVLVKRARRKFTKAPLEYLAVFEETKRGEPHLHILMRAPFIPQAWLSEQMSELISAPVVDIRHVGHARNAARYITKYVTKGPKPFASLKRYWSSKGYDLTAADRPKRAADFDSGWRVEKQPLWLLMEELLRHAAAVVWDGEHSAVALGWRGSG